MLNLIDHFKDKSVIIVGPSANIEQDYIELNKNINDFDIIVRMNNHWLKEDGVTGKRTDVIYHCFNKTSEDELLRMKKEEIILISRNDVDKFKSFAKISKFLTNNIKVNLPYHSIPKDFFDNCQKTLNCNPSTGVLSIMHLLSMPIKSITIIGFDFYETLYVNSSNHGLLRSIQQGRVANHDPKKQLAYLKELYKIEPRINIIGKLKEIFDR